MKILRFIGLAALTAAFLAWGLYTTAYDWGFFR